MTRKRTTEKDLLASASAAPAPARRKPAARTRSRRTATPGEATPTPAVEPVALEAEAAVAAVLEPSNDDVARLAYSYWEARGYQGGSAEEDWLRAVQELRVRSAAAIA